MEPDNDHKIESTKLDNLLNKYVAVWLWSLVFGGVTGTLYLLITVQLQYERWGYIGLVKVLFMLLSVALAILSSLSLYKGLSGYLIPRYILQRNITDEDTYKFALNLKRAFLSLVQAVLFRACMSLVDLLYSLK